LGKGEEGGGAFGGLVFGLQGIRHVLLVELPALPANQSDANERRRQKEVVLLPTPEEPEAVFEVAAGIALVHDDEVAVVTRHDFFAVRCAGQGPGEGVNGGLRARETGAGGAFLGRTVNHAGQGLKRNIAPEIPGRVKPGRRGF
jgi:hypothetical protein